MTESADRTLGGAVFRCRLARWMALVFVVLTAVISLEWSSAKLLSQDEMYEFQTDSVRSLEQLIHVQRTSPVSLDPLLYHALSHGAMVVFGADAMVQRLPALAGFLLMQVCLFVFVRRIAGDRAGAVAAAFPALTATLFYSAEGRPYGLLLGLYALALVCWQSAVRDIDTETEDRSLSLLGLALAIAATLNTHYFGVLLLVPVCAAEGWRTLARRKMDWAVWAAIGIGMLGELATRPFMKAAGEFRTHYYGGSVGLHDITRAYRTLFVDYTQMAMSAQHAWMVALAAGAVLLVWGCVRAAASDAVRMASAEWALLVSLAALPFFGYLLARFVTHSIEVRYVLGALVGISALLAVALSPWLRRDWVFNTALVVLGIGIVVSGVQRVRAEDGKTAQRQWSLLAPKYITNALLANADSRLYVQDMVAFEENRYYEPDAQVKARMTLVYSTDEELRWNKHDTMALTAEHLQQFTTLPVVNYEELRQEPGEHFFVLLHTGWDWTDQAFAAQGAHVRPVGSLMGGDVVAVRFR